MAKYRVYEMDIRGSQKKVYEGEVGDDVISGEHSLQPNAFGSRYWRDGRVWQEDQNRTVRRGLTCRFELVMP